MLQIRATRSHRSTNLDQLLAESDGILVTPNLSLTEFFTKELGCTPLWTRNAVLPFIHEHSESISLYGQQMGKVPTDPALDCTQSFILAEAARLSPRRTTRNEFKSRSKTMAKIFLLPKNEVNFFEPGFSTGDQKTKFFCRGTTSFLTPFFKPK